MLFQNDIRQYIPLSSFGFYEGGHLIVKISEFALLHGQDSKVVSDFPLCTFIDFLRFNIDDRPLISVRLIIR